MEKITDKTEQSDGKMPRGKRTAFIVAELTAVAATVLFLLANFLAVSGVLTVILIVLFFGGAAVHYAFLFNCVVVPGLGNAKSSLAYFTLTVNVCAVVFFILGIAFMLAKNSYSMIFYLLTVSFAIAGMASGAVTLYLDDGRISAKDRILQTAAFTLAVICVLSIVILFCTGTAVLSLR